MLISTGLQRALPQAGHKAKPSVVVIESRSVKSAKSGHRGFYVGKKTKSHKQHIPVDTLGFILKEVVLSVRIQDRTGERAALVRLFRLIFTLQNVVAVGGYDGKLIAWTHAMIGWAVKMVNRNETGKFVVLSKPWIVERTFAWLAFSRPLNRDYEINPCQSEVMIKLTMNLLLLNRLSLHFVETTTNRTYSWWGALLSALEKVTISLLRWFAKPSEAAIRDRFPVDWHVVG